MSLYLAGLCSVSLITEAQAPDTSTVLLVRNAGDERIVTALRAELMSYRFRVVEVDARASRRGQGLAALAQTRRAQAAVRVRTDEAAVEVWVESSAAEAEHGSEEVVSGSGLRAEVLALRVTEAMRARGLRLPTPPPAAAGTQPPAPIRGTASEASPPANDGSAGAPSPGGSSVSATANGAAREDANKQAEPVNARAPQPAAAPASGDSNRTAQDKPALARSAAGSKPVSPAGSSPAADPAAQEAPAPKPAAPRSAAPSSTRDEETKPPPSAAEPSRPIVPFPALVYAELSPAGVFSPGDPGLDPGFDVWVNARIQPTETSSLSLFALIPILQGPVTASEGSANVRMTAIGASADLHVPVQPFEITVGLGAASLLTSVRGQANAGDAALMDRSDPRRTAALFVRAGMAAQLAPALRVAGRVMVGMAVPELQISFDDRPVARWGRPLVIATLGLELALPWRR